MPTYPFSSGEPPHVIRRSDNIELEVTNFDHEGREILALSTLSWKGFAIVRGASQPNICEKPHRIKMLKAPTAVTA